MCGHVLQLLSALAELKSQREARWEDVERLTVRVTTIQASLDEAIEREEQRKAEISSLKEHIRMLENAVKSRNTELEDLTSRFDDLQATLRNKESMRLSQLETLAVRNVELEKQVFMERSNSCKF